MEEYKEFNMRESNEFSQISQNPVKPERPSNTLYDISYDDDELDYEEGG